MSGCDEVDAVVRSLRLGDPTWFERLDALTDVARCTTEGLARSAAAQDWLAFEQYVRAAARDPDRSMTSILCEMLQQRRDDIDNESIVEALEAIADPASVPCLTTALFWEPPWDDFHGLAVKTVWALSTIATSEAQDLLRGVAATGPAEVREAVRQACRVGDRPT
jgi:hypothetical protein